MRNPILHNKRILFIYVSIWVTISVFQISVLYLFYDFPILISHIDTLVYNGIFSIIVLGLWYTIRYLSIDNQSLFILVINYIIAEIIVVTIWILVSSFVCNLFLDSTEYGVFEKNSLPWKIALGVLYFLTIILFYYLSIYYSSFKEKQLNEANLKTLVKEIELNLLRSQLNPHFIFNSLNSISSLTIIEPYKAQEMVVKLSTYMRYALKKEEKQLTPLEEEIEYSKLYLEIEKVRFGEKLKCSMEIPDNALLMMVPCMILQPLLENAIKYGVHESTETVYIHLSIKLDNEMMHIELVNNFDSSIPTKKGTGSGIKNTRDRLKLIYHDKASFNTEKKDGNFKVYMAIPLN